VALNTESRSTCASPRRQGSNVRQTPLSRAMKSF
jgi:hypothetical protein